MENIAQFEFIPWILSLCASLAEVRKLLNRINIVNTPFSEQLPLAQLHWIIADENESITKNVFGLLHSMSHAFIRMAGELSGLSSNSLTEIIIVETASIFIYAQTSLGIPLGALSGMAEMRYEYFLRRVLEDSRNCVFDPICRDRDDTACSGCLIIPEISCNHFNAELGRKYMYSIDGVRSPKIGFWEM